MSTMTRNELRTRLMQEFGYPRGGAELVIEKILQMQPVILAEFREWWQKGTVSELEIEGYTVKGLMEEHGLNQLAAFITLDWLVREPDKAKACLRRGYDLIVMEE